ncbi:MAG: hypothetical protein LBV15_00935, partial [Planctomycetota bacterium]|nr:hypothetical protein [Planctomycetota bacterium]
MSDELAAEELELRDELIAAQSGFISAFSKALAEAEGMGAEDARRELAWARIEYLLETMFRLLEHTGEYDGFLSATEALKPASPPEAAGGEPALGTDDGEMPGAGLIFRDALGNRLLPALIGGAWTLVDARTSQVQAKEAEIAAEPEAAEPKAEKYDFPLIRGRAAWLRSLVWERLGKNAEAAKDAACLGIIRDWLILGPLDGETDIISLKPEAFLDDGGGAGLSGALPGWGAASWRPLSTLDAIGRLLPGAVFRSPGQKAVYALALVHSPRHGGAVFRFGSGSPAAIGVNSGFGHSDRFGGVQDPGHGRVDVWLRKGWNAVFLRSLSSPGSWGLAARLTTPEGDPFPARVIRPDGGNLRSILAEAGKTFRASVLDRHYR